MPILEVSTTRLYFFNDSEIELPVDFALKGISNLEINEFEETALSSTGQSITLYNRNSTQNTQTTFNHTAKNVSNLEFHFKNQPQENFKSRNGVDHFTKNYLKNAFLQALAKNEKNERAVDMLYAVFPPRARLAPQTTTELRLHLFSRKKLAMQDQIVLDMGSLGRKQYELAVKCEGMSIGLTPNQWFVSEDRFGRTMVQFGASVVGGPKKALELGLVNNSGNHEQLFVGIFRCFPQVPKQRPSDEIQIDHAALRTAGRKEARKSHSSSSSHSSEDGHAKTDDRGGDKPIRIEIELDKEGRCVLQWKYAFLEGSRLDLLTRAVPAIHKSKASLLSTSQIKDMIRKSVLKAKP